MIKMRRKAVTVKPAEGIAMMTVGTVEPVIATDTTATVARTIEITAIETAAGETETGEMIEMATDTTERRGTLMTRDMTTVIGEMTATAVMTEDTAEAVTTIVGDATVMDIATAVAGTGKPYECILMMGISLILSLLRGRVWFKGSPETYQSQIRSQTRTIRKAMELPVHLNLL